MLGGNYLRVKKYLFSRKKIFLFMIINIFLHENNFKALIRQSNYLSPISLIW